MPESISEMASLSEAAVRLIDGRFSAFGNVRRLTGSDLKSYVARNPRAGWRLDLALQGGRQQLDFLATDGFPFNRPLIAVAPEHFLQWPHVEEDGVLCALPDASTTNPYAPVAVADRLLSDAITLIEAGRGGSNIDDFRAEFLSYWNRTVPAGNAKVLSLLSNFEQCRPVALWRGQGHYVVAESVQQAEAWLRKRYSELSRSLSFERALLLTLDQPLLPSEYPQNSTDVLRLMRECRPEALPMVGSLLSSESKHHLILLTAPTARGPAMAGIRILPRVERNILGRQADPLTRGFRPGRIPQRLLMERFFSSASTSERLEVKRADSAWIHGRGQDNRHDRLAASKVTIFGIGSVGSFVAEHLACSGVGELRLIDPENLSFANAGRHILGVDSEGKSKAIEVANLLQRRFPHHTISGRQMTAQAYLAQERSTVDDCHLLLCLTGDWASESFVNDWYLRFAKIPNLLFGWTEAHATAGHAVLLAGRQSCLHCHVDDTGLADLKVTEWPGPTQLGEPACGGLFQPYGPVEIASINAMISSLALDALLGKATNSTHRVYVTEEELICELGGKLTDKWRQLSGQAVSNLRATMTFAWPRSKGCPRCQEEAAC